MPQVWERHVIKDLRPYVCTYGYCSSADQMYDSLRDWKGHESKAHAEEPREVCPMCDQSSDPYHIASHLRKIATFALPRSTGLEDDRDDADSGDSAAQTRSQASGFSSLSNSSDGITQGNAASVIPDLRAFLSQKIPSPVSCSEFLTYLRDNDLIVLSDLLIDYDATLERLHRDDQSSQDEEASRGDLTQLICRRFGTLQPHQRANLPADLLKYRNVLAGASPVGTLMSMVGAFEAALYQELEKFMEQSRETPREKWKRAYRIVRTRILLSRRTLRGNWKRARHVVLRRVRFRRGFQAEYQIYDHDLCISMEVAHDVAEKICYMGPPHMLHALQYARMKPKDFNESIANEVSNAASIGALDVIKRLVENYDASLGSQAERYGFPLAAAAFHDQREVVQYLIAHGAGVNARGGQFGSPLIGACLGRHFNTVKNLLAEHNADPNLLTSEIVWYSSLRVELIAPLHAAVMEGNIDIVKIMLEYRAEVDFKDSNDETALIEAAARGYADIVKVLLDAGPDVNARGDRTVLGSACEGGNLEIVRLLLDLEVHVNTMSGSGENALHIAFDRGCKEIVKLLMEHGADCNIKSCDGRTAFHFACQNDDPDILQLLLDRAQNFEVPDDYGRTPLHLACSKGSTEIVRMLLNSGAHVNAWTRNGKTVLL